MPRRSAAVSGGKGCASSIRTSSRVSQRGRGRARGKETGEPDERRRQTSIGLGRRSDYGPGGFRYRVPYDTWSLSDPRTIRDARKPLPRQVPRHLPPTGRASIPEPEGPKQLGRPHTARIRCAGYWAGDVAG